MRRAEASLENLGVLRFHRLVVGLTHLGLRHLRHLVLSESKPNSNALYWFILVLYHGFTWFYDEWSWYTMIVPVERATFMIFMGVIGPQCEVPHSPQTYPIRWAGPSWTNLSTSLAELTMGSTGGLARACIKTSCLTLTGASYPALQTFQQNATHQLDPAERAQLSFSCGGIRVSP